MAALSPLGRVPARRQRLRRPRRRYRLRFRRAIPALVMIIGLSALAGSVWLRVLDRVDAGAAGAAGTTACGPGTAAAGPLDPRRIQVRVYNSTDREGLARSVADQLRGRRFAVIATANDPLVDIRQVTGSAEVRHGPAGAKQAEVVRRQVPGAKLYRDVRADAVVDLALGPGYRRLSTPAELAKRQRAQGLVAPRPPRRRCRPADPRADGGPGLPAQPGRLPLRQLVAARGAGPVRRARPRPGARRPVRRHGVRGPAGLAGRRARCPRTAPPRPAARSPTGCGGRSWRASDCRSGRCATCGSSCRRWETGGGTGSR